MPIAAQPTGPDRPAGPAGFETPGPGPDPCPPVDLVTPGPRPPVDLVPPGPGPSGAPADILRVALVGGAGDRAGLEWLRQDPGLRLRAVRPPYREPDGGGPGDDVVLLRCQDTLHGVTRLLGAAEDPVPPVLMVCPRADLWQIEELFRLGVTSCLVDGDYEHATLTHALRSTRAGHTHLSPAAAAALARAAGHLRSDRGARVVFALSPRERQVMDLLAHGCRAPEIGERLSLRAKTVRNHLSAIYAKLGVRGRTEAILLWLAVPPRARRGPVGGPGTAGPTVAVPSSGDRRAAVQQVVRVR